MILCCGIELRNYTDIYHVVKETTLLVWCLSASVVDHLAPDAAGDRRLPRAKSVEKGDWITCRRIYEGVEAEHPTLLARPHLHVPFACRRKLHGEQQTSTLDLI